MPSGTSRLIETEVFVPTILHSPSLNPLIPPAATIEKEMERFTRGIIFEEAQILRIPSFVDTSRIYVVEREQSFHNH